MNGTNTLDLGEWHWMMHILQTIDVGLVVVDREYNVRVWNSFMENHSGISPEEASRSNLFEIFPDIQREWFQHKIDSVFLLGNRSYTLWEERPYVFKFKNYRPITSMADFMYQYTTLLPLKSTDDETSHVAIVIYDVTDIAVNRLALKDANTALEALSITDQMTQLFNRAHWENQLTNEYMRYNRRHDPVSLVMFDIDHFKKVNDTYGHHPGDLVIKAVAKTVLETKRETDIAGRYGGEEFGVILIGADAASTRFFAERLRKRVEALVVEADGHKINFTISLGIAEMSKEMKSHTHWLQCADAALYSSKRGGRNLTSTYTMDMKLDEGH
ncbi:sensor domain-containing diguanylate cyclase [Halioxenophilus aromaticivorans]|uniref:diguanylate cyclase n=1 Tax=Halioxenophilus aromaticivorans TaxID=1306992 RepID=A0AAV3TXE6_9ALTE